MLEFQDILGRVVLHCDSVLQIVSDFDQSSHSVVDSGVVGTSHNHSLSSDAFDMRKSLN